MGAVDLETGKLRWKHVVGWCFNPVLIAGPTAVGLGSEYKNKRTYASMKGVDIASGKLLWEHQLPDGFYHYANFKTHGGYVYLARGLSLLRVHARTGDTVGIAVPLADRKYDRAAWLVADDARVLLGYRKKLYRVDGETLTALPYASIDEGYTYTEQVELNGDHLYIGGSHGDERGSLTTKFDLRDGRVLWRYRARSYEEPVVAAGKVFLTTGHYIVALDDETGAVLWKTRARTLHAPLWHAGALYGDDYNHLVRYDPATGAILGKVTVDAEITTRPIYAAPKLLVGDMTGTLYAIQPW
jgi:outer membrane protein assembly factor BamB